MVWLWAILLILIACKPYKTNSSIPEESVLALPQTQPLPTNCMSLPPLSRLSEEIEAGHLVFVSDRDGNEEIYVMRSDGSQETRLTNHEARDYSPSWSPDGKQIVFVSDRDGSSELYIMPADGSQETRLTNTPYAENNPDWSPDGQHVLFEVFEEGKGHLIKTINLLNGEVRQVVDEDYEGGTPSWSPDGEYILFTSGRDHENIYQNELYIAYLKDNSIRPLSNIKEKTLFITPAISPDGHQVVFSTWPQPSKIFTMNIDTLETKQLIDYEQDAKTVSEMQQEFMPNWSPSGRYIIFSLSCSGNINIFVLDLSNRQLIRLTDHPANDLSPEWWSR
jgi:Tol biopolymer transport system component